MCTILQPVNWIITEIGVLHKKVVWSRPANLSLNSKNILFCVINVYQGVIIINIVLDVNECTNSRYPTNCDQNALCHDTVGSYYCECIVGYSGDGVKCTCKYEANVTTNDSSEITGSVCQTKHTCIL